MSFYFKFLFSFDFIYVQLYIVIVNFIYGGGMDLKHFDKSGL